MTATGSGPALPGAGTAALADGHAPASRSARSADVRLRTVLGLAAVEVSLLARSLLTLAGLIAGGAVVWLRIQTTQPLWWSAGWQLGAGQLILGLTVLAAAQLAAGRARRDSMTHLYASFPATAGTRTLGHLAGLAGAVPASLVLLGAGAAAVQGRGAIGSPSVMVLAAGVVLVIAAGAAGVAIGTRFAHPLAGVIGALLVFLPEATSHLSSGAGLWLAPWDILLNQLGNLPGPLAGYPPAGGHALELAGVALLAGVVALAMTVRGARARGGLVVAGVVAVPVIVFAAAAQLSPIPTTELKPPGDRDRRPGLGAALHHGQPRQVLPLPRLRPGPAIAGGSGRRGARASARPARPGAHGRAGRGAAEHHQRIPLLWPSAAAIPVGRTDHAESSQRSLGVGVLPFCRAVARRRRTAG
jgi:hypothetical protein